MDSNLIKDSSGLRGDSAALIDSLVEDGYLYFRDAIDCSRVNAACNDVCGVLRGCGLAKGSVPLRPRVLEFGTTSPNYLDVYKKLQSLESIHRIAFDCGLRSIMNGILSGFAYCHPNRIIRHVWPNTSPQAVPNIHFDYPTWGIRDMFTSWIPLTPISEAMGGLRVLSGSHRHPFSNCKWQALDCGGWKASDYHVGDVIIFHCYTVHAVPPNVSDYVRLSVDFRWHDVRNGTPDWVTTADANVGNWAELASQWKTQRWIEPPSFGVFEESGADFDIDALPVSQFVPR
ncbi:phytanoyl-CoA dioxygenase family protein [Rubinisphaera margarita]|uniref:phytanoyl-CoA dioxygenase family protein n=1 Tax=Rubinisphaera margarita TaxID=2909586 RepID=UPI001EE914EF|nr:phytanoyl-CoA dioxygenase family protein [Rubinisphaera margarita]MCG6157646.1 phytanoyl-CoA dioxygenase family protein [Rubinisphaera margarita]